MNRTSKVPCETHVLFGKILVGSVSSHGSLRSHRSHGSLRSHRSHGSLRSHGSHRCIMGLPVQQVFWVSKAASIGFFGILGLLA